jgi:hypothetical protein
MTRSRSSSRLAALGIAVLLVGSLPAAVAAEEEEGGIGAESFGTIDLREAGPAALLAPAGPVLSGRPWLMTEGMDPSLAQMPGWDPLTRLDWQSLGEGGFSSSAGSPRTQAAGAGAPVPFRDPGPAFSRNILVTRDFGNIPFQTEPHIEVNPNDPEHLVLGTIDYGFPSMSAYVSFDGGESWEGPNAVPYLLEDLTAGGDPVVGFSREGEVYMAYISIGIEEFNLGPIEIAAQVSSIAVGISDDLGFTWPLQVSTSRSRVDTTGLEADRFGRLRGTLTAGFLDKPWLAVGRHPEDPEQDVIYMTYTNFDTDYDILYIGEIPSLLPTEMRTTIELVVSEDGGRTWTDPVAVSPTVRRSFSERGASEAPGVVGILRVVQGSQPVVAPDGTVHVAWMDSTDDESQKGIAEIQVSRSTDAGRTWTTPTVATVFNEAEFRPRTNFFRFWASSFPQLAVGPDGELHIVYVGRPSDKPEDDGDVFITSSTDLGDSWTRPLRLNDDDTSRLQFFPSADVAPDGSVHVMWGDFRDSRSQTSYHIYYTSSTDAGETFGFENEDLDLRVGDTRVSDFPSNPNFGFPSGLFIGDYFSLAASEDDVYMVWADTRLGEFGPTNQKIAFARQEAVPQPEIFISPPAGPAGEEVTLQGFEFQPDLDVFVQLGDSTISTLRTDDEGGFTARLFMPITSEGSQTVSVFDESGNGASTSYFTEYGIGNIRDSIEELTERLDGLAPAPAESDGEDAPSEPTPGASAPADADGS